jgi:hypothetical protein
MLQDILEEAAQEAINEEELAISTSVNLSGGDRDLPAATPSSKRKKASNKKPPPDSDAYSRNVLEYYKSNAIQQDQMPCADDLLMKAVTELETLASTPYHCSRMKRGDTMTKCDCLRVLFYDDENNSPRTAIQMAVANYAVSHFKMDKFHQDQSFIDMYRMSQITASSQYNTNFFAVPFNNFEPNTGGELCHLTKEDMAILRLSWQRKRSKCRAGK